MDIQALAETAPVNELPELLGRLAHATATAQLRMAESMRPQPADLDRLVTIREAAEITGREEESLREAGRRGELPIVKVGDTGRGVRVRKGTLLEWHRIRESGRLRKGLL